MTLPTLTENDIRRYADPQSFQRGMGYYRHGAIHDPIRQENELRAECQGSQYEPYRVTVTLDEHGIADYNCSCPRGGFCKHVVALLLTWVRRPDAFHVMAPLDELLAHRSREELIVLIRELIARAPDLARLLELPHGPIRAGDFDPEPFRRQVSYALSRDDAEWAARELAQIRERADGYLEAGDPITAGALYHLILDEALVRIEGWLQWDENGDISGVLQDCAEGLDRGLEAAVADELTRQGWLEVLLEAELENIRLGGVDLAYPAGEVVLRRATAPEWVWIEDRLREALQGANEWTRGALVHYIAARRELMGQAAEADAFMLEHGTPQQRAFLLAERGRIDEAVAIAEQHFTDLPGLVIQFADALVKAGHREAAAAYMAGQLGYERGAWHYRPWLANHFEQHGDRQAALDLWRRQFEAAPRLEMYQTLRKLAIELGAWEQLRREVLTALDPVRAAPLLLDIALVEGDVAQALVIARRPNVLIGSERWEALATAAEAEHPRAALEIHQRLAERAIAARGRGNYQFAAAHLQQMQGLHQRLGEMAQWQTYIARLRAENRRLSALQEELDRAGL